MWPGSVAIPGVLCGLCLYPAHTKWAAEGKHCLCPAFQGTDPICVFIEFLWFPNQFLLYLQHFLRPFLHCEPVSSVLK